MREWSRTMLTVFVTAVACLWVSILTPKCSEIFRDPYSSGAWGCKSKSCSGVFLVNRSGYVGQKTEVLARYTKEVCKPKFNEKARVFDEDSDDDYIKISWACGKWDWDR